MQDGRESVILPVLAASSGVIASHRYVTKLSFGTVGRRLRPAVAAGIIASSRGSARAPARLKTSAGNAFW